MFFSPSTRGFYHADIHKSLPEDVIEITEDDHATLLGAQSQGASIVVGKNGVPAAKFPKPMTDAQKLASAKSEASRRMVQWIDDFLSQFTAKYPKHERDAWPLLALAAKAHLAGQPQQMILNEAAIVGDDPGIVAERIVQKSTLFSTIVDHARGLRQRTEAAIEAAETPAEVDDALTIAQGRARDMLDAILSQQVSAEL